MGKKKKSAEEEKGAGWIVSFADLMTLLFAAFVVLYALKEDGSHQVADSMEVATSAIREAFNEVNEEIPEEKTSRPIETGKRVFQYVKAELMRKPMITKFVVTNQVLNIINKDFKKLQELVKVPISSSSSKGEGKSEAISIHREDDGIRMRLLASHFFRPGEYRINRSSLRKLNKVGKALKDIGQRITVEGHSDTSPASGEITNWALSALRASSVVEYFISDVKFPPGQLRAAGYGDVKPLQSNATSEGRALNRRIEIKIHYPDETRVK